MLAKKSLLVVFHGENNGIKRYVDFSRFYVQNTRSHGYTNIKMA